MPVRMIGKLARLAMPPADYTDAARDGEGDGNLMGKRRSQHPQQLQDNIFAGNLFFDDLLAWRHSPEGEQFAEFSDTLCDVMEDVQLDARKRQFHLVRCRTARYRSIRRAHPPAISRHVP